MIDTTEKFLFLAMELRKILRAEKMLVHLDFCMIVTRKKYFPGDITEGAKFNETGPGTQAPG